MKNRKSVLVTGGAGFIGSHIIERLLTKSDIARVVCVDNLDRSYSVALKKENIAPFKDNKKFTFYKVDIRNSKALAKIFAHERPTQVIHLAAKTDTRTSVNEPLEHESVNVAGLINVLESAKDTKVKNVVFFSSSSVYGNNVKPPFGEEDATDFPLSPYAATKRAGELVAYTYFFNHGIPITCLRIFNAYGPRLRPSLVLYRWVEAILHDREIEMSGTGIRKRDFTHVEDIVRAVEKALAKNRGFNIFNIGSSRPASLTELLGIIEKVTNKKAKVKSRPSSKASVEATYAKISRAKDVLGWEPKWDLEKGVSDFVRWFKEHRL